SQRIELRIERRTTRTDLIVVDAVRETRARARVANQIEPCRRVRTRQIAKPIRIRCDYAALYGPCAVAASAKQTSDARRFVIADRAIRNVERDAAHTNARSFVAGDRAVRNVHGTRRNGRVFGFDTAECVTADRR